METLFGIAGAGTGLLVLFILYLGGAALLLRLLDGLLPPKRTEN